MSDSTWKVPSWLATAPAPSYDAAQRARIERLEADLAVQLAPKPRRLAHSLSVGRTAELLAGIYGVDPYLARVSGILHDWCKVTPSAELIEQARVLGIDLGVELGLVEPLLHGMVAARVLPARYPELPACVWQAIDRHTLGAADMSALDMVLFVADGIEPGRKPAPAIVHQCAMVGDAPLDELYLTCLADGITYVIDTRRYLYPGTLAIYNALVTDTHDKEPA